jgi:CRAL/TRIO domain
MLSANMPELLGRIYILNPGFIFKALWTIVTPFLDARTSKKIFFLGSGDSMKADLAKQIDEDNLLVEYGGKCTYTFNPDTDIEASYLMYRKDGKGGFKMTRDAPADGTTDDLLSPARTPGGGAAGAGAAP